MKENTKRKLINFIFTIFTGFILFGGTVLAEDVSDLNFCNANGVKLALKIVGYAIYVVKIIIPIVLIVYGIIDVTKAVFDAKDGLQKNLIQFAKRCIAAVLIFIAPSVINGLFKLVIKDDDAGYDYENETTKGSYKMCFTCLFDPTNEGDDGCKVEKYGQK